MNITPQPWTEIDSLAWIKLFAFDLRGNFRQEISRSIANQSLPPEQMAPFFNMYPADAPTTISHVGLGDRRVMELGSLLKFQLDLERQFGLGGRAVGSNAWAVSGLHTDNGEALLANDPHLGLQIPSLRYAVSARGKSLDIAGMSLVGLPPVIFGHNAHIAWGGTNMMADTQDLYLEHTDGSDPAFYDANGIKEPFSTRVEEIGVRTDFPEQLHKKYLPVKVHIRATRHGPIISDQFHVFDQHVSLRWTALEPGDTSYEAFYRPNFAKNWTAFNDALHSLVAPALNMIYADRSGNIGYLGAGRIPIRSSGNGSIPSPGWNNDHEWAGFIPECRWPQIFNPRSGYIVNANNKIVGPEYPYFISRDWASPARALRIRQMLSDKIDRKESLTITDMQHMQADTQEIEARQMMAALHDFVPQSEGQAKAWSYVKDWGGDMAADSQAAAIFHVWMRHFRKSLFSASFKGAWENPEQADYIGNIVENVEVAALAEILQQRSSPWCASKNMETAQRKSCQSLLASSLQQAIEEIYKMKGDRSVATWTWGAIQQTRYLHLPFSKIKPFDRVFEARIGNGGSRNSINVAASQYRDKEGYLQSFGPEFRQIISLDLSHISELYMNSTGQSGNRLSAYYADIVEPLREVHYYSLDTVSPQFYGEAESEAKSKELH